MYKQKEELIPIKNRISLKESYLDSKRKHTDLELMEYLEENK